MLGPFCSMLGDPKNLSIKEETEECRDVGAVAIEGEAQQSEVAGLRLFTKLVCAKVKSKGRTTYNEVADEIISELSMREKDDTTFVALSEKNIRRRVYDVFNVLWAVDLIAKEKKDVRWIGFPMKKNLDIFTLEVVEKKAINRIQEKADHFLELIEKFVDLKILMMRNQILCKYSSNLAQGISVPFLLVQTCLHSKVEIKMSEDTRLVHFDFNGKPFSLHDFSDILKEMRQQQMVAWSPPEEPESSNNRPRWSCCQVKS